MNLRAKPELKFLLKYLLIGIGCLAFAAWSAYDGFVAYPNKIPRAQAYAELLEKIESDPNLSDEDRKAEWTKIAEANGWSTKLLSKKESVETIEHNIVYQYAFIVIGLGIGIPCIFWYLRNCKTWIESTKTGLRNSAGQELTFSQIQKFDKKKWVNKGIGIVHYKTDQGVSKTFVIDDLKYDRQTTDEIVVQLESQIKHEMIVNGEPESMHPQVLAEDPSNSAEHSESV